MATNARETQELQDGFVQNTPTPAPVNEPTSETANRQQRKKYHSSALYAASKWHGTVKHVKGPNSGHGLLPTQM